MAAVSVKIMQKTFRFLSLSLFFLSACAGTSTATPTGVIVKEPSPLPVMTDTATAVLPTATATEPLPSVTAAPPAITPTATEDLRLLPKYWREWVVAPELSPFALSILSKGIAAGNDPHFFSRIGDCQSEPAVYLGIYNSERWKLPKDKVYLKSSIDYYQDAFTQTNVTAQQGFGISSVLSPLFADKERCNAAEPPLDCELRLRKPLIAFVAMGTNWQPNSSASFERYLRQVVDKLIENGTLPVLVNKPDNIEGDGLLNYAIAQVAYDYDLPMVNVWRALDHLPGHGLQADAMYMTPDAWNVRNLQTLIMLDKIRMATLGLSDVTQ